MLNVLKPLHERKQARQRWLYSCFAFACIILAAMQLMRTKQLQVLQSEPTIETTLPITVQQPTPAVFVEEPLISSPIEPELPSVQPPEPCAQLTPPNYEIAAVLWHQNGHQNGHQNVQRNGQQRGHQLVLRSPKGRHFTMTLGQRLEQSSWQLQSIENRSVVWRHLTLPCATEQAIKELNKQPFRY